MQAEGSQATLNLFWTRVSHLACIDPLPDDSSEKIKEVVQEWAEKFREVFEKKAEFSIPIDFAMRASNLSSAAKTCKCYIDVRRQLALSKYYEDDEIEAFYSTLLVYLNQTQQISHAHQILKNKVDVVVLTLFKWVIEDFPEAEQILKNPDILYLDNRDLKLDAKKLTEAKNRFQDIRDRALDFLEPTLQDPFVLEFPELVKIYNRTLNLEKPIAYPLHVNRLLRDIFKQRIQIHINTLGTGLLAIRSHEGKEKESQDLPSSTRATRARSLSWLPSIREINPNEKEKEPPRRVSPREGTSREGTLSRLSSFLNFSTQKSWQPKGPNENKGDGHE